ncbi:hypothetical protein PCO31110_03924 [Pandoraea communis]|uniref:Uncharacterized protein n=1 Tax=Pandoraea communis TaxID=2508297 RepID=A0A5E4XH56_9BURK|nr:hypothetical protein PCO31110_03924 [Pandoraea communis]
MARNMPSAWGMENGGASAKKRGRQGPMNEASLAARLPGTGGLATRDGAQRAPVVPDGRRASESVVLPVLAFCCATLSSLQEISSPMW